MAEQLLDMRGGRLDGCLPRAQGEAVRVLQWNVLAEGLSDDGFVVQDVLAPHGDEVAFPPPTEGQLDATMEAQATHLERAGRNLRATVDWEGRWARMRVIIASLQPDVITVQELDQMAQVQQRRSGPLHVATLYPCLGLSVSPPSPPSDSLSTLNLRLTSLSLGSDSRLVDFDSLSLLP